MPTKNLGGQTTIGKEYSTGISKKCYRHTSWAGVDQYERP